ncbi:aldo/keto reductase, partial [Candidatus Bipolaricaulota bacterium]|nr:aldo/keto reductase [Candidatus Bipolaricaulota bacterium]
EDYLRRMETDFVDVLLLHNCNEADDYETVMARGGQLDLAMSFVKEGKARFIGFSGHNVVTAKQAVESGAIDVLMFPINLASYAVPGKSEVLRACAENNVGLVAMKVFGGGSLLRDKATIEMHDFQMGRQQTAGAPSHYAAPKKITPVQCIAYALDRPELSTIVPGCKSTAELDETLAYYETDAAARDYAHILPVFAEFATGECVYCNHCLPCPSRIDIGGMISLLEQARREMTDNLRTAYGEMETDASDCIQCEQCSKRCPFGVDVVTKMAEAISFFGRA